MLIRTLFHCQANRTPGTVWHCCKRQLSFNRMKRILAAVTRLDSRHPPYSHVCQIGDPVLRKPALEVDVESIQTPEFQGMVKDLVHVMRQYHLCGIAAPQIGLPFQVFAIEQKEEELEFYPDKIKEIQGLKEIPLTIAVNPELKITNYQLITQEEMCASVHGFSANVPRYAELVLEALDINGQPFQLTADGYLARIIQHEYDHLHGILYTDKMDPSTLSLSFWQEVNRRNGKIMWSYRPTFKSRLLTAVFR